MIVFDDTEPVEKKLILYPHTISWENGLPVPQRAESSPIDLKDIWEEPLKAECNAFLNSIETRTKPLTSGEEGLKVLKTLEISQQSLEQKEKIGKKHGDSYLFCDSKNGSRPIFSPPFFEDVLIHPTSIVDDNVTIGKGTKIWHFSHILSGSKIGENCNIGQNCVVGPDVSIGNKCKIQNNVSIYKGVSLEDGVFCGPSMVFTNIYNPRAEISKMDQVRPILVKRGATLGANCTVICGHTIGSYAFIGAGAVITKDVPDYALMVGNPARQNGWVCVCGGKLDEQFICTTCYQEFKRANHMLVR
jgi:UDP-2-acetamido-3-amino-2,3-dideoxy-glucuronate N-acetyltransferase